MSGSKFYPDQLRFMTWLNAVDAALATAKNDADLQAIWLLWLDPLLESDSDTGVMCAAMKRRHLRRFEQVNTRRPARKRFASGILASRRWSTPN
ncbi:MAG: hypothetical protein AAAB35_29650 [Phyllobacterium sp.]|uniref:hypothetical protein n=1 Tax=Phyllobacterium sp. TaxID=1871046 RepID=UPI0030F31E7F